MRRDAAATSLGQIASEQEAVISALLNTLRDPKSRMHAAAAECLGQIASDREVVISALLNALRQRPVISKAAAEGLGQMKIASPAQLRRALILLNRLPYGSGYGEREAAVEAISRLVAGHALPGNLWKPV